MQKKLGRVRGEVSVVGFLTVEIASGAWNGCVQKIVNVGLRWPLTNLFMQYLHEKCPAASQPIDNAGPFLGGVGEPAAITTACLALIFLDWCRHGLVLCHPRKIRIIYARGLRM